MNEVATAALTATRDWAVKELEFAKARAENLRVGGEAYNSAIAAIKDLTHMVDELAYLIGEKRYEWEDAPEPIREVTPDMAVGEDSTGKVHSGKSITNTDPDPDPEPKTPPRVVDLAEVRTKAKAARVVDLAEVRTKAKAARDAGVKLADVWAAFDATKLSEVPHEKYGDVLDMLEEKLKELD